MIGEYMKGFIYLLLATFLEVIGTSNLKLTNGFRNLVPSLIVAFSYCLAMYCLSHAVRFIPMGIVYAIWSGIGIVMITLIGYIFYREYLNIFQISGIILILLGVILVQIFSTGH